MADRPRTNKATRNRGLPVSIGLALAVLIGLWLVSRLDGIQPVSFGYHVTAAPSIAFDTASSSGSESSTLPTVNVSLSGTATGHDVTVDYAVTGGTATGGRTDFTLPSGTLTFTSGSTTESISISVTDDSGIESDETIEITLSNADEGSLGATTVHTYTIEDDDALPTVAFDAASSSGSEGTTPVSLGVSLSASSPSTVTVDFAVTGGSAIGGGVDFTLASGTLTFNPGITAQSISVSINNDALDESNETIEITLSDPGNAALGAPTVHTYTIEDDDAAAAVEDEGAAADTGAGAGGGAAGGGGGGADGGGSGAAGGSASDIADIIDQSGDDGLGAEEVSEIADIITDVAADGDTGQQEAVADLVTDLALSTNSEDNDAVADLVTDLALSTESDQNDAVADLITDLALSTESDQNDAVADLITDLAVSTDTGQNDAAANIITDLAVSTDSGQNDAVANIITDLAVSTDTGQNDAVANIITDLAVSTDSGQNDAAANIITDLAVSTDSGQNHAVANIITDLAVSTDSGQNDAVANIITDLAVSTDSGQNHAVANIITDLAVSTDSGQNDAVANIITDLAVSTDSGQNDAAANIITDLAVSTDTGQNDAVADLITDLALSTESDQNDAVADLITDLAVSTDTGQNDAAANIITDLAVSTDSGQNDAVANIITDLAVSEDPDQQQAVANVGELAAEDAENAAEVTELFTQLSDNPTALENISRSLPVEVFTPEVPPESGTEGWQTTLAPNGEVTTTIGILTKFPTDSPAASVDIQEFPAVPEGTPPLPEDQVVNSVFELTPVNFESSPMANNIVVQVDKSFVSENDLHPWSIEFNRFDEASQTWVTLTAKLVSETGDQLVYSVSPPGFSLWAITGSKTVPPVRFQTEDLRISPVNIAEGKTVGISVDVSNLTAGRAEYNAVLSLNDEVNLSQAVVIEGNSKVTISFEVTPGTGLYHARVGSALGDFTVVPAPVPTAEAPTPTPILAPTAAPPATPAPPGEDAGGFPIGGIIGIVLGVLAAVGAGVYFVLRMRRGAVEA